MPAPHTWMRKGRQGCRDPAILPTLPQERLHPGIQGCGDARITAQDPNTQTESAVASNDDLSVTFRTGLGRGGGPKFPGAFERPTQFSKMKNLFFP